MRLSSVFALVIIFAAFTHLAQSQTRLGVYGGANFSSLSTESPAEHSGLTAFTTGLILEHAFESNLRISVQPGYLQKAAQSTVEIYLLSTEIILHTYKADFRADYITIPIMLSYDFDFQSIRPYVTTGMSFDFLLGARQKELETWQDIKEYLERYDMSLNIGAGASIPIGDNFVFVELRYLHGILNVSKKEGSQTLLVPNQDSDVTTRGLVLSAGYVFSL